MIELSEKEKIAVFGGNPVAVVAAVITGGYALYEVGKKIGAEIVKGMKAEAKANSGT